jgi:nitroreductase
VEVFDAVRTLLAVRAYDERAVPEETLRRILEAGRLSASSMNRQPWHFIVVQDKAALPELARRSGSGPYIAGAAAAIAVAVEKASKFAISDASRAVQSMMLTAWAEGVGSNWVGFAPMDEVGAFLGVPADLVVLTVIPFGYPASVTGAGKKRRKPLREIAHRERFGRPFA